MKRQHYVFCFFLIIWAMMSNTIMTHATDTKGKWVKMDFKQIVNPNVDDPNWQEVYTVADGSISYRFTNSDDVAIKTITSWSNINSYYEANQKIEINLAIKVDEDKWNASIYPVYDKAAIGFSMNYQPDRSKYYFSNLNDGLGKSNVGCSVGKYGDNDVTIKEDSAIFKGYFPNAGKEGDEIALVVESSKGCQAIYVYRWFNEAKEPEKPVLRDAGCIFSDLAGQVEVLNPTGYNEDGVPQYDDDWHFAKIDEPLYVGTKIKTGIDSYDGNSSAIISFADMSTLILKSSTQIILSSPTVKENNIKIIAGNVWANVKKMVKDGSMDVEMSQAVAGIKGTTFVCEVKADGTSTLKVIEGIVQFTDIATGKISTVTAGKMIAAGPQAVPLSDFDIKTEYKDWQKYKSDLALPEKSNPITIIVSIIIFIIVIGCAFVLYLKKRNNNLHR